MTKQERKFTLGQVNTTMGVMGEVHIDQTLLDVLGIKPGDFLIFTISTDGVVTVTGEKKAAVTKSAATSPGGAGITPTDVTQPALFDPEQPSPRPPQLRRIR
jgi:bifunctional DNA-binding transcriptional regulator/antitoxin component of YhaV-PrlF toxin-antitoxin module